MGRTGGPLVSRLMRLAVRSGARLYGPAVRQGFVGANDWGAHFLLVFALVSDF